MKERFNYEWIVKLFKLRNIVYRLNSNTKAGVHDYMYIPDVCTCCTYYYVQLGVHNYRKLQAVSYSTNSVEYEQLAFCCQREDFSSAVNHTTALFYTSILSFLWL